MNDSCVNCSENLIYFSFNLSVDDTCDQKRLDFIFLDFQLARDRGQLDTIAELYDRNAERCNKIYRV